MQLEMLEQNLRCTPEDKRARACYLYWHICRYMSIYNMYVCLCVHHKCLFHHLANETWPRLGMMSWRCVARSSLPKWIATWMNSMTFRFWGFSGEHLPSCKRYGGLIEVEGCNIRVRSLGHSVLQYAAPVCSGFDLFADGVVGCYNVPLRFGLGPLGVWD